ncbi:hypothetical protein L1887_18178 [Cichorium endivia]|nr:hypothetical protein L1887_18178 [Cichorium endivia]
MENQDFDDNMEAEEYEAYNYEEEAYEYNDNNSSTSEADEYEEEVRKRLRILNQKQVCAAGVTNTSITIGELALREL